MSSSSWKQLGSPTLIPSMTELRAFYGRLYSPLRILANLPIQLGGKTILINFVVMNGPVDYNILSGHDFIYAMNDVVSSLFWAMIFPHEGWIITIDQLSYSNPPTPQYFHNRTSPHVSHIKSMHFVSTATTRATPTPLKNESMALESPPHHLGLGLGGFIHPWGNTCIFLPPI